MSSFRNTFGKEQSEKNLQYDNTAFLHFSISFSVAAIFVLLFLLVRQIVTNQQSRRLKKVRNNVIFAKQVQLEQKLESARLRSNSVRWKILLIVILGVISWLAHARISQDGNQLKGFDPYELLGVDYDAPIDKVKKAYRKLALQLHPDRNPNNPEASGKFMLVSKAYECLTDEKIKQKCLKYGNPDGQESFKLGIALPSFLIQKDNHIIVMCWTFIIMILVIPRLFLKWNFKLQAKDERGILVQNYNAMYGIMSQQLSRNSLDFLVSGMKEVTDPKKDNVIVTIKPSVEENKKIDEVNEEKVNNVDEENNEQQNQSGSEKQEETVEQEVQTQMVEAVITQSIRDNLILIEKHRCKQVIEEDLIRKFPQLLREMVVFILDFCTRSQNKRSYILADQKSHQVPFLGMNQYHCVVRYSQEFYQNRPRNTHSLNQISLTQQQQAYFGQKFTIFQLIKLKEAQDILFNEITDETRRAYLKKEINSLPNIGFQTVTMAGSDLQNTFTSNDITTFKFFIKRQATQENPHGIAYLKDYPYLKEEKYYLTLEFSDILVYFEEVTLQPGQLYETSFNYVHKGQPQDMNFVAMLYSDCYFGLDYEQTVPVRYIQDKGVRKIKFHPTDKKLEVIPKNAIEQMLSLDVNGGGEDEMLSDTEEQQELEEQEGGMHQHPGRCCDHEGEHEHEEEQQQHYHPQGEECHCGQELQEGQYFLIENGEEQVDQEDGELDEENEGQTTNEPERQKITELEHPQTEEVSNT